MSRLKPPDSLGTGGFWPAGGRTVAEECVMAQILMTGWNNFSLSKEQFKQIAKDFAAAMDDGLNARPSPLQMLRAFVGRPAGNESGKYLALDFGGTNLRVAKVELCGTKKPRISKIHKVSLKQAGGGVDYTSANVDVDTLFDFIAQQIAIVDNGTDAMLLGHSFSYASQQTSLGRAKLVGWTKEIKVTGVAGQDINGLLAAALARQSIGNIQPVAVINDTTATLLAAAYSQSEADLGSVCGTGHNTCYYEALPQQEASARMMAYNSESGGFDKLPFNAIDDQLDADSEYPGQQRLEKMVAGRYLGELTRRVLLSGRSDCGMNFLDECHAFQMVDGLSGIDVALFVGDDTKDLADIKRWVEKQLPGYSGTLAERHFIKAVSEMVVDRSAALIAASYAGFLLRMDPQYRRKHIIGINGSLYEKVPRFAIGIQMSLENLGDWNSEQVSFHLVDEAPLIGAAIAAAMAKDGESS